MTKWPPERGEDLPPHLTKTPQWEDAGLLAELYERALRRIALEKSYRGEPTDAARMAYDTLLGHIV